MFGIGRLDEGLCGTPRAQPAEFLLLEGAVEEAWIALAKDPSTAANAMIPVAFVAASEPRPSARLSLANGITIEVPAGVSPEALGRLIGAAMDVFAAPEDGAPLSCGRRTRSNMCLITPLTTQA